jgi:hypothetical protein
LNPEDGIQLQDNKKISKQVKKARTAYSLFYSEFYERNKKDGSIKT